MLLPGCRTWHLPLLSCMMFLSAHFCWGPSGWQHSLWCTNHSSQFCVVCKFACQSVGFSSQAAAGHSATRSFYQDFHQCKEGIMARQPNIPRAVSWVPHLGHLYRAGLCDSSPFTYTSKWQSVRSTGTWVRFLAEDRCLLCFIFLSKLFPYPRGVPPSAQLHQETITWSILPLVTSTPCSWFHCKHQWVNVEFSDGDTDRVGYWVMQRY